MLYLDVHNGFSFVAGPLTALACFATWNFLLTGAEGSLTRSRNPALGQLLVLGGFAFVGPVFLLLTLRAFEGEVLGGALTLSTAHAAWLWFYLNFTLAASSCALASPGVRTALYHPEFSAALAALAYCWTLALCVRSLFNFILLLELAGLCLMYVLLLSAPTRGHATAKGLVQAVTTFLWVSIFSLLAMLWAAYFTAVWWPLFLTEGVSLSSAFATPTVAVSSLLPLAFLLKLMVLPWQGALVGFYRQLSLQGLLLYIVFYYPAFLLTALPVFGATVALAPAFGAGALGLLIFSSVTTLAGAQAPVIDLRAALAVSSAFNIVFLLSVLFFFS